MHLTSRYRLCSSSCPQEGDALAKSISMSCPVTGTDLAPRGRSFWNHRFVDQLRLAMLGEKNVTVRAVCMYACLLDL